MKRKALLSIMKHREISCRQLGRESGILFPLLILKLWGILEFTIWEICKISKCIGLSKEDIHYIFFEEKVS